MADIIDMANDIAAADLARSIAAARVPLDPGYPGECEGCGEDMPRLVNGKCGYCRDEQARRARR